jgi:RND family efflux transporter MFP subunit
MEGDPLIGRSTRLMTYPTRHLASLAAAALAALVVMGCGGEPASRAAERGQGDEPRTVRVVPAARGELPEVVAVAGTLAAEEEVVLGMKVAGRLGQVTVDLGSRVGRGQLLARLVPTDFELRVRQAAAALEQARARLGLGPEDAGDEVDAEETALVLQARAVLAEAEARRNRARALFAEQLLPRADLDEAEASFQVAQGRYQDANDEVLNRRALLAQRRSELELARQQLADSVLLAPFAGAVRERHAVPGVFVSAGQPVVTLVRIHPLRLRLAVPERAAANVRIGQPVRVGVEGDPRAYAGRVARLSPAIEESNRTLLVEAEVPNTDGALRPGAFAAAEILTSGGRPVVFVPASAIINFAGIEKVLTVEDGKSVEKRVRTGRRVGERVEVIEGIAAGEDVVVAPGNLVGGQAVAVRR